MQGVINCVVAYSHGFIHPPLTFQVEVWFRVDQQSTYPIKVKVKETNDVYDALREAKHELELKNLGKVCVKFNGEIVQRDARISQYSTSAGNPLLLELPEPKGKLHAVTCLMLQVLGEPCNLHFGCYGVEPGSTTKSIHTLQCSSWCSGLECLFASSLSFMVYLAEPSLIQATKAHRTFRRKDSMMH